MATYESFEELPVWKDAIHLAELVYELTAKSDFKGQYSMRDQIERAAVSVSNNIAEGYERGTTNELLQFIYIARGSSVEVRSMLCLIERLPRFFNVRPQLPEIKDVSESCSRQLRAWADYLQNSDIKGQRHLNKEEQQKIRKKKEAEEFQDFLISHLDKNNPTRIAYEEKKKRAQE